MPFILVLFCAPPASHRSRPPPLAQLRPLVTALEGGLQHQLADGGANLSVGERQLLCFALQTKVLPAGSKLPRIGGGEFLLERVGL